jgi:hypothetical protein
MSKEVPTAPEAPESLASAGTSAATRAGAAAARAGVTGPDVERLPFDLSALDEDGVFINVDARGFGLLDRRLDWNSLGIALPRESAVAFRPPRCGLLPDRYRLPLLRTASRAHAVLHRYSFRFRLTETLFETPAYRWVPWSAFETFDAEFQANLAELEAARSGVLDHHETVRAEVVETFLRLASDSACRLEATGHLIPEGFEEAVVRSVLDAFPTPDDLRNRLQLRYRVGVLLLGSEMLSEQRRAREERRALEATEAALRIDRQQETAREREIQIELWATEERARRQLADEEAHRRREQEVKERLRQIKLEAARERIAETMSPLEEGAKQLHAAVFDAATAIQTSLQQHNALRGASARRARELVRWFRLMNWQSDAELDALLDELEHLASRPTGKRKRDPGPIDDVLTDIIDRCYADAREFATPHRLGALEL